MTIFYHVQLWVKAKHLNGTPANGMESWVAMRKMKQCKVHRLESGKPWVALCLPCKCSTEDISPSLARKTSPAHLPQLSLHVHEKGFKSIN